MTSVGARLREERLKTGVSQGDFARLGGVGRNSQFEYESGKTAPNTTYLSAIGNHGIDVSYIVTGRKLADSLSVRLTEVLDAFSKLTPAWQETVTAVIVQALQSQTDKNAKLATARASTTPPLVLPTERVLVRMFEALLLGIDPQAELDEQAQLLARRLPIALSQVQDVLPGSDRQAAPTPEHASDPASRAKHRHEPTQ